MWDYGLQVDNFKFSWVLSLLHVILDPRAALLWVTSHRELLTYTLSVTLHFLYSVEFNDFVYVIKYKKYITKHLLHNGIMYRIMANIHIK